MKMLFSCDPPDVPSDSWASVTNGSLVTDVTKSQFKGLNIPGAVHTPKTLYQSLQRSKGLRGQGLRMHKTFKLIGFSLASTWHHYNMTQVSLYKAWSWVIVSTETLLKRWTKQVCLLIYNSWISRGQCQTSEPATQDNKGNQSVFTTKQKRSNLFNTAAHQYLQ